jgi:hypothetical protein
MEYADLVGVDGAYTSVCTFLLLSISQLLWTVPQKGFRTALAFRRRESNKAESLDCGDLSEGARNCGHELPTKRRSGKIQREIVSIRLHSAICFR